MKKILAIILAALLIFSMVACSKEEEKESKEEEEKNAVADNSVDVKEGSFEYATNDEGDYEIVGFTPASLNAVDLTLPKETEDGRDIVGIGKDAFKAKLTVKSVTFPSTYTYVDDYAFYGCDNLEKVVMTDAVTDICDGAFQGCAKLSILTLSKNIKVVGADAFRGCASLASLDLSNAISIGQSAFFGCSVLASITVSDKLTYASAHAFINAAMITYTVENGGKYLGNPENPYVLLVGPASLDAEICKVNDKTKIIAQWAFAYCPALETVELGDGVTVIDGSCFENDPQFDKSFGDADIPVTDLNFNEYENGYYLGTDSNPYMALIYIQATDNDDFTIHKDVKIIADTAFANSKINDIGYIGTQETWDAVIKSENWDDDRNINVLITAPEPAPAE